MLLFQLSQLHQLLSFWFWYSKSDNIYERKKRLRVRSRFSYFITYLVLICKVGFTILSHAATCAWRAHGSLNAVFSQHTLVCSATVLTSSVAVENKFLVPSAKSQGIGKRPFAKLAVDVFAHFISNHLFVFQIQDGSKINPPHVGGDIGNISCSEFIKSIGRKVITVVWLKVPKVSRDSLGAK